MMDYIADIGLIYENLDEFINSNKPLKYIVVNMDKMEKKTYDNNPEISDIPLDWEGNILKFFTLTPSNNNETRFDRFREID
jgi:hypothetical protein